MQPLLVHPVPPPELAQALDLAGRAYEVARTADELRSRRPDGGWSGAIVIAGDAAPGTGREGWDICRRLRKQPDPIPILVLVSGRDIDELDGRDDLYDDFCLTPFHPRVLDRRIEHLLWRSGIAERGAELITYDKLVLNVDTYHAAIDGRPLDLTHMEYELLKFLAASPGRVFTREALLSQVWGYDYFGGARTVDVHIRRLRSKLGEEHAGMIQTVRSVGYSLGR